MGLPRLISGETASRPDSRLRETAKQLWLLVTGDLTPLGGMDCANHALALYLARRADTEVHLVTHRAWDDLTALPSVQLHRCSGRGEPLAGNAVVGPGWPALGRPPGASGARVVVNGGNCAWADVNWVHYVHAAWIPRQGGGLARCAKAMAFHQYAQYTERACVRQARSIIANSEQTRTALIERLGVPAERVRTIYYGIDAERFRPPTEAERAAARVQMGWADDRPAVAFVGALGDLRKGFDTLFEAWRLLGRDASWDARLVVAGAGHQPDRLAGTRGRGATLAVDSVPRVPLRHSGHLGSLRPFGEPDSLRGLWPECAGGPLLRPARLGERLGRSGGAVSSRPERTALARPGRCKRPGRPAAVLARCAR